MINVKSPKFSTLSEKIEQEIKNHDILLALKHARELDDLVSKEAKQHNEFHTKFPLSEPDHYYHSALKKIYDTGTIADHLVAHMHEKTCAFYDKVID